MRRIVGVGVVALALVAAAGCGSDDDGSGESLPGKSGSKSSSGPQVSGIIVLDKAPPGSDGERWSLQAYDPDNGKNTMTIAVPVGEIQRVPTRTDTLTQWPARQAAYDRAHFSADWKYAAYAGKDGIHVLKLDMASRSYVPKTIVKPKASYSGGKPVYYTPRFAPQGHRLWFESWPSIQRRLDNEGKRKLVSVDYTSPGKPREELTLPEGNDLTTWRVLPDGTAATIVHTDPTAATTDEVKLYQPNGKRAAAIDDGGVHLRYVPAGDRIGYADLDVTSASSSEKRHYASFATVDNHTVLMRSAPRPATQFGPVITVQIDPGQQKVTVEPEAKGGAAVLRGTAFEPGKDRVVLTNADGWFETKLSASSEPKLLRKPVKRGPSLAGLKPIVIGWAE